MGFRFNRFLPDFVGAAEPYLSEPVVRRHPTATRVLALAVEGRVTSPATTVSPTPDRWNLGAELFTRIAPRAMLTVGAAALAATLATLLRISPFSFRASVVTATFWFGALMLVSFRRNVGRMLLWLILVDTTLAIYQVSIYSEVGNGYVLVRIGPVLLGGAILGAVCLTRRRGRSRIPSLWVACSVPALIPLAQGSIPIADGFLLWGLCVLYPLSFYLAANVMRLEHPASDRLDSVIACGVIAACMVPLALLPLELSHRATGGVASLQVGARSYTTLGIVFLLAPLLLHRLRGSSVRTRVLSLSAVLALFGMSFSRGALVSALLLLVGIFVLGRKLRSRLFLGLGASLVVLWQLVRWTYPQLMANVEQFWLLRTNIGSNASAETDFDLSQFLDSGRNEIWTFGVAAWENSLIWGHGIGSTPYLFKDATNGVLGYSGMHNLVLTVLAERGLFGFLGVLFLFGSITRLIFRSRGLSLTHSVVMFSFLVFLTFALTTGVELFLNSTRATNASVTVFLFLFLAFLEAKDPADSVRNTRRTPQPRGEASESGTQAETIRAG